MERLNSPSIVIATLAHKGGVGKSTTAAGIAARFAHDMDTLLVDCDPQQTATSARLTAVKAAHASGHNEVTLRSVYDFDQTRIKPGQGRQGTFDQLVRIGGGQQEREDDPNGGVVPQPRVMVIDGPPQVIETNLGIVDYLTTVRRSALLVVTTPNDVDLSDSLQTYRDFTAAFPGVNAFMLLNKVENSRLDHKELTPDEMPFPTLQTVIPANAASSRLFRWDQSRSHRASKLYHSLAGEIIRSFDATAAGAS